MSAAFVFSGFGSYPVLQAPHFKELLAVGRGNVVVCAMLLLLHVSSPSYCFLFVRVVVVCCARRAVASFERSIDSITVAVGFESQVLAFDWFHDVSPCLCFLLCG